MRCARFVRQDWPNNELRLMRMALQQGHLTGKKRFLDEAESWPLLRRPLEIGSLAVAYGTDPPLGRDYATGLQPKVCV